MKERESVIDQATEVVLKKEERDFTALFLEAEQARKRAEGCGCPQCRKYATRVEEDVCWEAWRFDASYYHPDHEEEWIAEQAIKKLFRDKGEP